MMAQPPIPEEFRVSRRLVPMIGALLALAPAMAHAQTNIDEGKSPAQIFSSTCATCHKSTRGLAGGRGSLALKSYLAEHYTSSSDQAAALAAYVLGAGGGENVPAAEGRGPKVEHARLPTDEPSPPSHPTRQTKREEAPVTATPQPPPSEDAKPIQPSIMQEPNSGAGDHRPAATRREVQPAIATRGHQKQLDTSPPVGKPAAVVAEPALRETPTQEVNPEPSPGPSAAAPANADSGDGTPVPRDNIPD
jgi:hypothetical protein